MLSIMRYSVTLGNTDEEKDSNKLSWKFSTKGHDYSSASYLKYLFILSPNGNTVGTLPQIAHPLSNFISTIDLIHIKAWRKIFRCLFSQHPLSIHWDPYGCHSFLQEIINNQLIYILNESQHCLCWLMCHIVEEQQKLRHAPRKKIFKHIYQTHRCLLA